MNTKINQVEKFLITGKHLTVLDCFLMFGTFELRKIVCVLKTKGLKIGSEWLNNHNSGSRYKKYYIIK